MTQSYGYQTSQVQSTQQAFASAQSGNLVATFQGAQYPGFVIERISITGPQVPTGSHLRIYLDAIGGRQLTVVDKTDTNNYTPPIPPTITPGGIVIVVWENVTLNASIPTYATLWCHGAA